MAPLVYLRLALNRTAYLLVPEWPEPPNSGMILIPPWSSQASALRPTLGVKPQL